MASSVHLCLDMQRLFAQGSPWATPWMARVLPNAVRLAEAFGPRNVFTRFIPPLTAQDMPGRWQTFYRKWDAMTLSNLDPDLLELVAPLARLAPPGIVFDKATYSAFHDGRLHSFLQQKHVGTLVMSGAETDICVLATVLDGVDYGYRVVLVEDAMCSSSDEGHDALMTMYRMRLSIQIEVSSTDEVLAMIAEG